MHIAKIAAALLLPLAAVAEEPLTTVTSTSYQTLTKTITLERAAIETVGSNATVALSTPTGSSKPATSTPATPTGAASTLSGAPMALVAVAGAVFAVLL